MKFLKLASFCLMSTLLSNNEYIVNATENRTFFYGTSEFNIQCSPIQNGSRELSQTINNAFNEMCIVDLTKGYQGHIVLNHDNRNILLSRYSLTQEEGNCGFDALSLNRETFGDLFINAFSAESWTKYSQEQKSKLCELLYIILATWKSEFKVSNNTFDDFLQSQSYDPSKYFDVLSNSVNTYINANNGLHDQIFL